MEIRVEQQALLVQSLQKAGVAPAPPVSGLGLVDTGATFTSIDSKVAQKLWLQPVGIAKLGTAAGPVDQHIFAVRLTLAGSNILPLEIQVIGCDLTGQNVPGTNEPLIALLGRDLLARGILVYNGSAGCWTFAI